MILLILAGICVLVSIISIIVTIFVEDKKFGIRFSVIEIISAILFTSVGIPARVVSVNRYNNMIGSKKYIEENWNSEDPFIQLDVQTKYYQYISKLTYIERENDSGPLFSFYYGLDIGKLELHLS